MADDENAKSAEIDDLKVKPLYAPANLMQMKRGLRIEQEIGISALHEIVRLLNKYGCEAKKMRNVQRLTPKEHIDVLFQVAQYTRPRIKPVEEQAAHELEGQLDQGGSQMVLDFDWASPVLEQRVEEHRREKDALENERADKAE